MNATKDPMKIELFVAKPCKAGGESAEGFWLYDPLKLVHRSTKSSAIMAVGEVVEKGKIIDAQKKWHGKDFDTVVLAAPVEIAGKDNYMAVVIKRKVVDKNKTKGDFQNFYVHAIGWVDIKKGNRSFTTAAETESSETSGGPTAAIDRLLDLLVDVKLYDTLKMVYRSTKLLL